MRAGPQHGSRHRQKGDRHRKIQGIARRDRPPHQGPRNRRDRPDRHNRGHCAKEIAQLFRQTLIGTFFVILHRQGKALIHQKIGNKRPCACPSCPQMWRKGDRIHQHPQINRQGRDQNNQHWRMLFQQSQRGKLRGPSKDHYRKQNDFIKMQARLRGQQPKQRRKRHDHRHKGQCIDHAAPKALPAQSRTSLLYAGCRRV